MKKIGLTFITTLSIIMINSCMVTEPKAKKPKISVQVGLNKGGITENTDLSIVPNVFSEDEQIDGYSGATKLGVNAAIHLNKLFRIGEFESGIDFMHNHQTFTYSDLGNNYLGERELSVSQFMIPITYNFNLLKNALPHANLQLKIGYVGQINLISINDNSQQLPGYVINRWSNGATFGISALPIQLNNGARMGFFLDGYRGTRIYEDYYNQATFEMPGSSFCKIGIKYQFQNKK